MTTEVLLAVLLLITNVLWAVNTHRLINKLMSRSFFEYAEANLQKEKLEVNVKKTPEVPQAYEDFGSLSEIMP